MIGTCRQGTRQWIKDNLMYNYPISDNELKKYPELLSVSNIVVKYRNTIIGYFDITEAKIVDKQQLKELNYPIKSSKHQTNNKYILYKLKANENGIPTFGTNDFTQIIGKGVK